jgi:transcriptional regulator with GAF, ATPase, and Fis domain
MIPVAVPRAGSISIGRAEACDMTLGDASISRRHAVVHGGEPPMVEDLGSRNGTRVGGRQLAPGERVPLTPGTLLELGSVPVIVQRGAPNLAPTRAPGSGLPANVVLADPAMKQIYELVDIVAPSNMAVLILGETGVGKEVFAETVHRRSARAGKPFLKLNCAALPESILESELFGHERGAFTGAVQTKPGLFESADGGTVFLDEVGEIPLTIQAKLLRVLESGEVMRVGSVKSKRIDVRFISATNRDLETRVAEGQFRADLFFRLNGYSVTLPPLRERPSDVAALADVFLRDACRRMSRPALAFTPEVRNVIDRAALLCQAPRVDAAHLAFAARSPGMAPARPTVPPPVTEPSLPPLVVTAPPTPPPAPVVVRPLPAPPPPSSPRNLRAEVESLERERILSALEQCGGNQSRAAKMLGIARRTLLMRLDAYGIVRPRKGQGT